MLFHGTRTVNVAGILQHSLKLPRQLSNVAITGAMFGQGIYWADDWKKSAGYTSADSACWSRGSGKVSNRHLFIIVGDVIAGNLWVAPRYGGYTEPPSGYHSIFGKMGHSGVQNNEYIVFNPAQINMRYLVEFSI